jgi:hypothetical protein
MITGYNTDIEHEGVIYHVQTEDKGLDSPIVLSLVYTGGAILAAKRASYADLIAAGFEEAALAERLKRQHRLICAAIHAGRIEELKQLNKGQTGRLVAEHADLMNHEAGASVNLEDAGETGAPSFAELSEQLPTVAPKDEQSSDDETKVGAITQAGSVTEQTPEADFETQATGSSPFTVYDSRRRSRLGEVLEEPDGLRITLLPRTTFLWWRSDPIESGCYANIRQSGSAVERGGSFHQDIGNYLQARFTFSKNGPRRGLGCRDAHSAVHFGPGCNCGEGCGR